MTDDINGNGKCEESKKSNNGVPGVTVEVLDESTDLVVASGFTNSHGEASIKNGPTGKDLKLRFVPTTSPFGSTFTSQKADRDPNKESNADENSMMDSFKLMVWLHDFTGLDAGILLAARNSGNKSV